MFGEKLTVPKGRWLIVYIILTYIHMVYYWYWVPFINIVNYIISVCVCVCNKIPYHREIFINKFPLNCLGNKVFSQFTTKCDFFFVHSFPQIIFNPPNSKYNRGRDASVPGLWHIEFELQLRFSVHISE